MKIKFLILLLLTLTSAFAQDSVVYKPLEIEEAIPEPAADSVYEAMQQKLPATEAEAPQYTSRNFTENYKDDYKGSDFNYKSENSAEGESLLERFFRWLRRLLKGPDTTNADGSVTGFGVFWYTLMVLIILAVAYFIARAVMGKESAWIFGRSRRKIAVYDAKAEDLNRMDFAALIAQTQQEGNYRLAIRYYYLWLLKKLSEREVINWHADKTNADYYYEIKNNALRDDFKYLSYVYDYSWYGEFPVDESAFAKAEKAFKKTFNALPS